MKNMRQLINLMEGVMAVPAIGETPVVETAWAEAIDDPMGAEQDPGAMAMGDVGAQPESAVSSDLVHQALEMFTNMVNNSFVEPAQALERVMDHYEQSGASGDELSCIEDAIMEHHGIEVVDDEPGDGMTDVEADADTLKSTGWGTDEDYGDFGNDEMYEDGQNVVAVDGKEVDVSSIVIDGVNTRDYPDFADAYAISAAFIDGTPLSDIELEKLQYEHGDLIHELAHNSLHEDLNNGYGDINNAKGDDYFPNGADSPVVKAVGPSGARQGDNPEQKKMEVTEVHKELVYGYRNFLKEAKAARKEDKYTNKYDYLGAGGGSVDSDGHEKWNKEQARIAKQKEKDQKADSKKKVNEAGNQLVHVKHITADSNGNPVSDNLFTTTDGKGNYPLCEDGEVFFALKQNNPGIQQIDGPPYSTYKELFLYSVNGKLGLYDGNFQLKKSFNNIHDFLYDYQQDPHFAAPYTINF